MLHFPVRAGLPQLMLTVLLALASPLAAHGSQTAADSSAGQKQLQEQIREGIANGNSARVIEALQNGADLKQDGLDKWVLSWAANYGSLKLLQLALEKGADPNQSLYRNELNIERTPLMMAATFNQLEAIKLLLRYKASINALDSAGQDALALAAEKNHLEVVNYLLSQGAQVNPALKHMASLGNQQMLKRLLPQAQTAQETQGVLEAAAAANQYPIVSILLAERSGEWNAIAAINAAFRKALAHAQPQMLDLLLEQNQDLPLNQADAGGIPPLFLALEAGQLDNFLWLLRHGARPDTPRADGRSPLQALLATAPAVIDPEACNDCSTYLPYRDLAFQPRGVAPYLEALLQKGARIPALSMTQLLFLDQRLGPLPQSLLAKALNPAELRQTDPQGKTWLHRAVANWSPGLITYLAAHQADLNAPDKQGNPPLLGLFAHYHLDDGDLMFTHPEQIRSFEATVQAILATPIRLGARNRKGQGILDLLMEKYAENYLPEKGMNAHLTNACLHKAALQFLAAGAPVPQSADRVSGILLHEMELGYEHETEVVQLRHRLIQALLSKGLKLSPKLVQASRTGMP